MGANAVFQYNNEVRVVNKALQARGESIAELLASVSVEPLLLYDDVTLNSHAEFTSKQKDIVFATVVNEEKIPLTHYLDFKNRYISQIKLAEDSVDIQPVVEQLKNNRNILFFETPVIFEGKKLAYAWVGIDRTPYEALARRNMFEIIAVAIAVGLFVGITIILLFKYKIFRPIKILTRGTQDIAEFRFDEQIVIPGQGELAVLADSFNQMRLQLKKTIASRNLVMQELSDLNESLEERVHERTQELQILNSKIAHEAMHDPLTGLPNRVLVTEQLQQTISHSQRTGTSFAVFIMDLNNFKEVNDTLGHPEGDRLLVDVAQRLAEVVRESDTVGRLGGDEFAMVLPDINEADAVKVANKIHEQLLPSFALDDHSIKIGASIGIAMYPIHAEEHTALVRLADVAMYEAKKDKSNICVYKTDFDKYSPLRLSLMDYLQTALDTEQLELHYQPKVSLTENRVTSVEALIRWYHPELGLIFPDQFIPIAENSGLIDKLSDWIMEQAFKQWRQWQDAGIDLQIAINLSARNLSNPDLPEYVAGLCDKYQMHTDGIKTEITESAIMYNPEQVIEIMSDENMQKLRFSIDDFGTGYSSLSYLKRLPVSEVKIDKSFVFDMVNNESDASIVKSVINLVHSFDYSVVAEGVENLETLRMLENLGCDVAQGYLFSKALPVDELIAKIKTIEDRFSANS